MVGRQLDPIGVGDEMAAGDTQQRVMRLIVIGGREIGLVGRDQRQALTIGDVDQTALDAALAVGAMTLTLR